MLYLARLRRNKRFSPILYFKEAFTIWYDHGKRSKTDINFRNNYLCFRHYLFLWYDTYYCCLIIELIYIILYKCNLKQYKVLAYNEIIQETLPKLNENFFEKILSQASNRDLFKFIKYFKDHDDENSQSEAGSDILIISSKIRIIFRHFKY